MKKLALNKETLRSISENASNQVAAGVVGNTVGCNTQAFSCRHYAVSGCLPCWA